MSIFKRFEKVKKGEQIHGGSDNNWGDMSSVPFSGDQTTVETHDTEQSREDEKAKRQQDKIIVALILGENRYRDVINQHSVTISDDVRDSFIDKLAKKEITVDDERKFLEHIAGPGDQPGGYGKIEHSLGTVQEQNILYSMVGDRFKGPQAVQSFLLRYPTPADFEADKMRFLHDRARSSARSEDVASDMYSMNEFCRKVYGKRQEYWDQMLELNRQGASRWKKMELEQSSEWLPGEASCWQVSRVQVGDDLVTKEGIEQGVWADDSCQDAFFARPERQVYGVFDGVGGSSNGRLASHIAADVLRENCDRYSLQHCSSLANVIDSAHDRIMAADAIGDGCTTASIASVIDRNGIKKLAYAQVGDSRIYIVDKFGKARQVTQDEGEGNLIYNAVGGNMVGDRLCCQQLGEVDLHAGDRVVMCTDGITGDFGNDLMDVDEIGDIVSKSHGTQDAAKKLMAAARKCDDRTVIVFVPDLNK